MWRCKILRHRGQRPYLPDPFLTGSAVDILLLKGPIPLLFFRGRPGPSYVQQASVGSAGRRLL